MKQAVPPESLNEKESAHKKLGEIYGEEVRIGVQIVGSGAFDMILAADICGILVTQASGEGYVRVSGKGEDEQVDTAPNKAPEYILITVKEGQSCAAMGTCTYNIITRKGAD